MPLLSSLCSARSSFLLLSAHPRLSFALGIFPPSSPSNPPLLLLLLHGSCALFPFSVLAASNVSSFHRAGGSLVGRPRLVFLLLPNCQEPRVTRLPRPNFIPFGGLPRSVGTGLLNTRHGCPNGSLEIAAAMEYSTRRSTQTTTSFERRGFAVPPRIFFEDDEPPP